AASLRGVVHMAALLQRQTRAFLQFLGVAWLCSGLLVYLYYLHTLSDFPLGLHPDEAEKLEQISRGTRNFFHPQFLIESNRWLAYFTSSHSAPELAAQGRLLSNALAALSIALIALATFRIIRRTWVLFVTPPLLMFSILLLAAGRYIKDDIFFIFSISLNVAAL